MTQERRKQDLSKAAPLPQDYLKMVSDVFNANFDSGLKALAKVSPGKAGFSATGAIYGTEIVFAVSLTQKGQLAATTIYGSVDYDPKASSPSVEDLLSVCVDAIGGLFSQLLDPADKKKLEQLADQSLSALEDIPYDWTSVAVEKRSVFLKVDKANPNLDSMADDWLAKHDPKYKMREEEEQQEIEKLFVTGPTTPKGPKNTH